MSGPLTSETLRLPIRDLRLKIAGSRLEPIVAEFLDELRALGLHAVIPRLYLSTEWGVVEGTCAIAIPFYLASTELTNFHGERVGHVEGRNPADILRYLRHEMGHVVNYSYALYRDPAWEERFGAMSRPYLDDYEPVPFSRDFVKHLPGWYAQKHPDEDWAETFAVWMTPNRDWSRDYEDWPVALRKLQYCELAMRGLATRKPFASSEEFDEDVSEIGESLAEFYAERASPTIAPHGADSALLSIFDEATHETRAPASDLIRRHLPELAAAIYHWTGRFPEWTRPMLLRLAERADALGLSSSPDVENAVLIRLTAFATSLAATRAG